MSIRKLLPLLLTLLLFTVIGFFIFTDNAATPTEVETPPPVDNIDMIDDVPPLTIIEETPIATDAAAALAAEATDFVDNLTTPQTTPVAVDADNPGEFVRYDGAITLPTAAQADGKTSTYQHDLAPDADIPTTAQTGGKTSRFDHDTPTIIQIQDIVQNPDIAANSMFYTHHVTEQDTQ